MGSLTRFPGGRPRRGVRTGNRTRPVRGPYRAPGRVRFLRFPAEPVRNRFKVNPDGFGRVRTGSIFGGRLVPGNGPGFSAAGRDLDLGIPDAALGKQQLEGEGEEVATLADPGPPLGLGGL